jgi:hypothetical protein
VPIVYGFLKTWYTITNLGIRATQLKVPEPPQDTVSSDHDPKRRKEGERSPRQRQPMITTIIGKRFGKRKRLEIYLTKLHNNFRHKI